MFDFFSNLPHFIETVGLFGFFFIVFAESGLFFGFFLPGDSLLFTAGLLSSQGFFNPMVLFIGCAIAAILGDSFGYFFGKKVGPKIFTKEDSFFFRKDHILRTKNFYEKHGKKTVILARFLPIIRTFAPIMAGVGEMHYRTFAYYNIVGGTLWSALVIFLGYFLGSKIPGIDQYIIPIILGIIVVSTAPVIFQIFKKITIVKK
jgi:membrane-associated protein